MAGPVAAIATAAQVPIVSRIILAIEKPNEASVHAAAKELHLLGGDRRTARVTFEDQWIFRQSVTK